MEDMEHPNGFTSVVGPVLNEDVISSLVYQEYDATGSLVDVDASSQVELRYKVNTFDEESQTMISSDE